MIAPVAAQTAPASAVVMYSMNSLTPAFFVRAAMTSPPILTPSPPLIAGKSNQSMSVPIVRAVLTCPGAVAPTKPPPQYISAAGGGGDAGLVVHIGSGRGAERLADAVDEAAGESGIDAAVDVGLIEDVGHGRDGRCDRRIAPVAICAEELRVRLGSSLANVDALEPVGQRPAIGSAESERLGAASGEFRQGSL